MIKTRKPILLILAVVGTIFLGNLDTAAAVTTGKWYTKAASHKKVRKASKKKKKAYILFFYTDWCGYCKKINKKYLSNPKVKSILSSHYKVKINPEKGFEEMDLAKKKGVRGFPDFRVVRPNGSSMRIHPFQKDGVWTVKKFITELKAALVTGS
ncbi:MAG: thioredoxin family protein [Candidatus Electrothrix sp. AR4]|nr:thioredoxin family protein [Candidatus Electrothrix sp. AR4]